MAKLVQVNKKIALLHRYTKDRIKETNAAFPYLQEKGIDVLTFKKFDRLSNWDRFFKSFFWVFYAPFLVLGKDYDVIYCDDSYPWYPALVKLASPKSKVIIRLGDFHLMYYASGIIYRFLHYFEKIAWRMADDILVISEAMANYFWNEKDIKQCQLVLDPVDPKDFLGVHSDTQEGVMFHGVLTRNKNVDILLEAARRLPDVDFTIIGDGPDRKRLMKIAPKNVFFYGWVPFKDIPRKIAGCSIGVALRGDNIGNEYVVTSPFLQYGVMGKPCLVTRRLVYGDYEWQFSSARALVDKIKILLDRPGEGRKLQEYVLKNHDAKIISEQIWGILTSA